MSKLSEIQEILVIYNSVYRNIHNTHVLTGKSLNILRKYILIGEGLNYEILLDLDKKGIEKLTLGIAELLAKSVINMDEQLELYEKVKLLKNPQKKEIIKQEMICNICCESKPLKEIMKCCNNKLCQTCLLTMMKQELANYYFKSCKCPFCNKYMSIEYIRYLVNDINYNSKKYWLSTCYDYEYWRYTNNYKRNQYVKDYNKIYCFNIYKYFIRTLHLIENIQNKVVYDNNTDIDYLLKPNENDVEKIYGECYTCSRNIHLRITNRKQNFNRLHLGYINKECANGEGELLVVTPELFRCVVCKSREEEMENIVIKKCPHCGVRNMRPNGCNYVVCGDHRWCWICEERLENNNNGHNVHYHTGPGTNPYMNKCRVSVNYNAPKFTIKGKCKCASCKEHNGAPLCRTTDCMNRTSLKKYKFNKYCNECMEDIHDLLEV